VFLKYAFFGIVFVESEVFVGWIPRDCIESELVPVFEKAGKIYEIRLMMDYSLNNRGYCFVQYHKAEEATKACEILNHYEIRPGTRLKCHEEKVSLFVGDGFFKDSFAFLTGCKIGVTKSVDNRRLFFGGIPKDKTSADVFEEINNITDGVTDANVVPSYRNTSFNRGFAYVDYKSHK
jgi:hypothetical protein